MGQPAYLEPTQQDICAAARALVERHRFWAGKSHRHVELSQLEPQELHQALLSGATVHWGEWHLWMDDAAQAAAAIWGIGPRHPFSVTRSDLEGARLACCLIGQNAAAEGESSWQ